MSQTHREVCVSFYNHNKSCSEIAKEQNISIDSEGYKHDIASNHSDVMHWFPKYGKSMDTFRADVKAGLAAPEAQDTPTKYYRVQLGAFSVKANAEAMLKKVKATGFAEAIITQITK